MANGKAWSVPDFHYAAAVAGELGDIIGQTLFAYDETGHLIGEYDETGNAIAEYLWLGDQPIAMLKGSTIYYIHVDHLNTPQAVTDESQQVVWTADYSPFGEVDVAETSTIEFNLRFPGQYYDQETGLNYNYFRSYNPATGRYTQSDPIGLMGGLNTFGYAMQTPNTLYDPYGLWIPPSIPEEAADALTGAADALSLGIGPLLRDLYDIDGGIDECSLAYKAGQYGSLALGAGRLAYAGIAKGLPFLVYGGRTALGQALRISAARNFLKQAFRLNPFSRYRIYSPWDILRKYGRYPEVITDAARRTNPVLNAVGANAAIGASVNASRCECN